MDSQVEFVAVKSEEETNEYTTELTESETKCMGGTSKSQNVEKDQEKKCENPSTSHIEFPKFAKLLLESTKCSFFRSSIEVDEPITLEESKVNSAVLSDVTTEENIFDEVFFSDVIAEEVVNTEVVVSDVITIQDESVETSNEQGYGSICGHAEEDHYGCEEIEIK